MNRTSTATRAIGIGYATFRYEHDVTAMRDEYTWDITPGWRTWTTWTIGDDSLTFDFTTTPPEVR